MTTTSLASADKEAEEAVLGAVLLSERSVPRLLDEGLRPHHFYYSNYGAVFSAVMSLHGHNKPVDYLTVAREVERLGGVTNVDSIPTFIDQLTGAVPFVGNALSYAQRVMELASWRDRRLAAFSLLEATDKRSLDEWSRGLASLEEVGRETKMDSLTPDQWGELLLDYIAAPPLEGFIPLPFNDLSKAMGGGIMPGEVCLVAGYTNHGKSIFADQWLDIAAKHGKRVHLYMTEMTASQRGLRLLTRRTGIKFSTLRSRSLKPEQATRVLDEIKRGMPYGVSIVSGWDIEDVVRDALRARWDMIVIDLIHGFHYQDERDLDRLSKAAQRLARVSTTRKGHPGTAVVLVAHLSNIQMRESRTAKRPMPGLHSVKGATSLGQDSDFVIFVWQQDDEKGIPGGTGEIYIPKARSGGFQAVKVKLNDRHFRFEVDATEEAAF